VTGGFNHGTHSISEDDERISLRLISTIRIPYTIQDNIIDLTETFLEYVPLLFSAHFVSLKLASAPHITCPSALVYLELANAQGHYLIFALLT
jgi:hypothetical protein